MASSADDSATVNMVRTWLIAQNPPTASGPYQQAYAAALNAAFMNVLGQGNAPVNFRVNAGIIIKYISGPKESLAPTVILLLTDKSPAVVLWGERAAEEVFPLAMQNANGAFNAAGGMGSKMLDAVVKSVTTQPDAPMAGDVAEAAYRAINPHLWDVKLTPPAGPMASLVDANLKLQGIRIQIYKTVGVPANPVADTYASYFFFWPGTWTVMNQQQQQQAVQSATDLTSYMGQRAAMLQAASQNQELISALKEEGKWIQKLGVILNDTNVQTAGQTLSVLHPDMTGKTVTDACDNAFAQLSQNQVISAWQPALAPALNLSGGSKSADNTGTTPTSLAPQ
jgi:hypothetical protein